MDAEVTSVKSNQSYNSKTGIITQQVKSVMEYERDPNGMNTYLQVNWDDVIAEPDGIRSTDCAWGLSEKCFNGTKQGCYLCLSTVFGPCGAFALGINFACLAFQHIWCLAPTLRQCKVNCTFTRNMLRVCLQGCCGPAQEVAGMFFSKIKVRYQRVPDGDDTDILVI